MSSIANIIAFDGAATPVTHTLVAIDVTKDKTGRVLATWREQLASLPVYAQIRKTLSMEKTAKSGMYKVESRTVVPVMESISGQNSSGYTAAPKVAYENTMVHTGWFSERSSIAERRLVRQLALNIGGSIATSVAPVVTGPDPEAFDLLVAPT